jgi:hypothetical protein
MSDPLTKLQDENNIAKVNNAKKPFIAGDDKADYTDPKGKDWLAKKGEDLSELKERAAKDG